MVGLPVTLLCCLKFNLAVSPQLENEVATETLASIELSIDDMIFHN